MRRSARYPGAVVRLTIAVLAGALLAGALAGCEQAGSDRAEGAAMRFTMIIYDSPGNPFWTKVVNGTREMSDLLGSSVDIQYADGDASKQRHILSSAIANQVDGIGVALNYTDAYDDLVEQAIDAGIPVIAFNIDDELGPDGNARMAYIGQDMVTAGYLIAKRLIADGGLEAGDFVACPVESPEAVYAVQRYAGVRKAFEEAGIGSEKIATGTISLSDTTTKLTQYLLGHTETDAVCGMGQMPMEAAPRACEAAGLDIPIVGFDLTRRIAESIAAGESIATVDQQPFYQGAFTVMQLYFYRKYGLLPCDVNTGGAIVDASNVDLVMDLADSIR